MSEQEKPGSKAATDENSPASSPSSADTAAAGKREPAERDPTRVSASQPAGGEDAATQTEPPNTDRAYADESPAADAEDGGDREAREEPDRQPSGEQERRAGGGAAAVAWIALLTAVAAVALGAWQWWQDRAAEKDPTAELESRISDLRTETVATTESLEESLQEARNELSRRLGSLQSEVENAADADRLERLERQFRESRDVVESLPGRMRNLEESLANLQGTSAGARDAWLIAEAEYYMQLANAQAQLAGNAQLAAFALELADRRIRELGDPAYTPVRRELADEITALRAVDSVDVEGVSLTLASLGEVVQSLPLAEDITPAATERKAVDEELTGIDRAWAAVKNAFSDIVRIRRTDEQLEPLLSPEAQYFLRTNLALQMQIARLALLKGEAPVFRQSLDDARSWLQRYFDTSATSVSGAIETLTEIRDSQVSAELPDISDSLRLFRQQQSLAENDE